MHSVRPSALLKRTPGPAPKDWLSIYRVRVEEGAPGLALKVRSCHSGSHSLRLAFCRSLCEVGSSALTTRLGFVAMST